jgi:hypothetical protein
MQEFLSMYLAEHVSVGWRRHRARPPTLFQPRGRAHLRLVLPLDAADRKRQICGASAPGAASPVGCCSPSLVPCSMGPRETSLQSCPIVMLRTFDGGPGENQGKLRLSLWWSREAEHCHGCRSARLAVAQRWQKVPKTLGTAFTLEEEKIGRIL